MNAGALLVLGLAAGGLLLLMKGGDSGPRAVTLDAGKRYRFAGFVKPALPDDQVDAFSDALDVSGAERVSITQQSDRTLVRYEQTVQASHAVTLGQPMGFGFLPGEFVLTEARAI